MLLAHGTPCVHANQQSCIKLAPSFSPSSHRFQKRNTASAANSMVCALCATHFHVLQPLDNCWEPTRCVFCFLLTFHAGTGHALQAEHPSCSSQAVKNSGVKGHAMIHHSPFLEDDDLDEVAAPKGQQANPMHAMGMNGWEDNPKSKQSVMNESHFKMPLS